MGFSTLPPFDLQHVAPFLIGVGVVLSIAGWTDVALSYWPSRFGYTELEFGTVAQTFDAMPLPTLGLGLLAIGVLARGGSIVWSRALSVAFAAIGLACAASMLVFALDVPVAVLTNAALLSRSNVCQDLARTDLVVAKLDAPDESLLQTINRPVADISWFQVLKGIQAFRQQFDGRLALQMMFIDANRRRADEMAALARSLDPDEVQLNTPLRASPTPPLGRSAMAIIELAFAGLPVVNVYDAQPPMVPALDRAEMRRRRPMEGHPQVAKKEVI